MGIQKRFTKTAFTKTAFGKTAFTKASLKVGGLLFAGFLATACNPAADETFVVDTTADVVDANIGDGVCDTGTGACSLRAAVQEANADPNISAIDLVGGDTYTLTIVGIEDAAAAGDLDITEPAYITTGGTGQATIDANGVVGSGGVFHVLSTSGIHLLENLNITGAPGQNGVDTDAGAEVEVQIDHTRIHDNRIGLNVTGGGVVKVSDSTIDNNNASGSSFGGVFADNGSTVELFNTTIADNTGLAQIGDFSSATFVIESSTITGTIPAIDLFDAASTVSVTSSIIDTGGANCELNFLGATASSGGGNVASDATCGLTAAGDTQNSANVVKALADNGGPVPTQMPHLFGAANNTRACGPDAGADARGELRAANTQCDKGAVESQEDYTNPTYPDLEATGVDCIANITEIDVVAGGDYANCDLSGMIHPGAKDLTGAYMYLANISSSEFAVVNLTNATITAADATGTTFNSANLTGISAFDTIFTQAALVNATTTGSSFFGNVWDNTFCPDGTNSDGNPGSTCQGFGL